MESTHPRSGAPEWMNVPTEDDDVDPSGGEDVALLGEEERREGGQLGGPSSPSNEADLTGWRRELLDAKEAAYEAANMWTLAFAVAAFAVSYASLIGLGPWLGPAAGSWLHARGLWRAPDGNWGRGLLGGRTTHTREGLDRTLVDVEAFASRARSLPEPFEVCFFVAGGVAERGRRVATSRPHPDHCAP